MLRFRIWFYTLLDELFPETKTFSTDCFFPEIFIGRVRKSLPDCAQNLLTETVLLLAIQRVNEQLEPIKQHIKQLGYPSFSVYACRGNGTDRNSHLVLLEIYRQAVEYRIKAGLSFQHEQVWLHKSEQSINKLYQAILAANNNAVA